MISIQTHVCKFSNNILELLYLFSLILSVPLTTTIDTPLVIPAKKKGKKRKERRKRKRSISKLQDPTEYDFIQ